MGRRPQRKRDITTERRRSGKPGKPPRDAEPSEAPATDRVGPADSGRASSKRPGNSLPAHLWIPVSCLAGLLVGIAIYSGVARRHASSDDAVRMAQDNHLLVTQQLDEVFGQIGKRVLADPTEFDRFADLLRVYYVYDSRFVDQNEGNPMTAAESAYASQRLAQCDLLFGDVGMSREHYRTALLGLKKLAAEKPDHTRLILADLLDTHLRLAMMEKQHGNREEATQLFLDAVNYVGDSEILIGGIDNKWIDPLLFNLATLGAGLDRCGDAMALAIRFRDATRSAAESGKGDQEATERAKRASHFLRTLHDACGDRDS